MNTSQYEIGDLLKLLPVDYRAEGVSRELIESGGIRVDHTLLLPVGAFDRSFGHEIELVSLEKAEEGRQDHLEIHIRREGVLDMLPPGLLFQIDATDEERTANRMVRDAERHDTALKQARQFFAPFDAEFGHLRLRLEIFEHQSMGCPLAHYADELIDLLWPGLLMPMTDYQKALLLELSLCLSQVCGSHRACEGYLEKFFGFPVQLESHPSHELALCSAQGLGGASLGVDMIPFESFEDHHHVLVRLGPVPGETMMDFRQHEPVGKSYRLLSFLCEILLSAEFSWSLDLIPRETGFRIDSTRNNGILGYTTIPG